MIRNFFLIIGKPLLPQVVLLFILILLASVLELIGIGIIPFIISVLFSEESLLYKVPLFLRDDLQIIIDFKNDNFNTALILFLVGLFFIFFLKNIILLFAAALEALLSLKIKILNGKKLFQFYLDLPIIFHTSNNSSKLIRNLQIGVTNSSVLVFTIINLFKEFFILISLSILILIASFEISLFIISLFLFCIIIFIFFIKNKLNKRGKKQANYHKIHLTNIRQAIESIKETKVYGLTKQLFTNYSKVFLSLEKNTFFVTVLNKIPRILLEQIAVLFICLVVIYMYNQNPDPGKIIPVLSLAALAALRMIPSFNQIALSISQYKFRKPLLDIHINELKRLKAFKSKKNISKEKFKLLKNLELKNISYNYSNKKKILHKINLIIKKGQMISVIGKSGSGKTTLINIMLGLLKPTDGSINIDGKNRDLNNPNWQSSIGYVPQDVYLFDDTIENNIVFGRNNLSEREKNLRIKNLIKILGLGELISTMNNGIKTIVGEKGTRISGGEKQRIGMARALYLNPEIIILDEASSSLDIPLENLIFKNLKKYYKNKTIISISHRKIPLKYSNKVYDIKKKVLLKKIINN